MSAPSAARSSPPTPVRAVIGLLAVFLLGCGATSSPSGSEPRITVAAAASTADALDEIAGSFEATGRGSIEVNLDSSGILARQIREGAPVDVFLSADEIPITELTEAGLVTGDPIVIARNRVVLITPPGDPAGIGDLTGLARADLVALCHPDAPCGRAAERALTAAGVELDEGSISRGRNARETLRAVADGGLAAGIVFATDARIAGDRVEVLEVPAGVPPVELLAARIDRGDPDGGAVDRFLDFLWGPEAGAILADHGFLPGG